MTDKHVHEWKPLGFVEHEHCGGMVPTDKCVCGMFKLGDHGLTAMGVFASATAGNAGDVHLVRVATIASEISPIQIALCGTVSTVGWQGANSWATCRPCARLWELHPGMIHALEAPPVAAGGE